MSRILCAPLFKGDKEPPQGEGGDVMLWHSQNEQLITGMVGGERIPYGGYMRLLEEMKPHNRQLVENIARVTAANIHSTMLRDAGEDTDLAFVEGCTWNWGARPRTGSDTLLEIHHGVIPPQVNTVLPSPMTENHSSRTLEEMRKVFELAGDFGMERVEGVTHPYHQTRSRAIAEEVWRAEAPELRQPTVHTPLSVARSFDERLRGKGRREGYEQFMIDVIEAGEPTEETDAQERKKERMLTALMRARQMTGGRIDPEAMILKGMKLLRKR